VTIGEIGDCLFDIGVHRSQSKRRTFANAHKRLGFLVKRA
jgi:hypothetical protein